MSSGEFVDGRAVTAVLDELDALDARLAGMPLHGLTSPELLRVADRLETRRRRQPAFEHWVLDQLTKQTSPVELGATSWREVLSTRLRVSDTEARRRLDEAHDLGPRVALSGEPLAPQLAATAAAQAAGQIGAEHVRIIHKFVDELPDSVDYQTREQAEATLARVACGHKPEGLREAADRLLTLLHPDGNYSDAERARRRYLTLGLQGADGMSDIKGRLDPEARATLDAVFAKLAAPGMCNPDDQSRVWTARPARRPSRVMRAVRLSAIMMRSMPDSKCDTPAGSAAAHQVGNFVGVLHGLDRTRCRRTGKNQCCPTPLARV